MIEPDYKHVLFKDLKPYLKKKDYLSGFTPTEQAFIRKNIGITEEFLQYQGSYKETTHSDLLTSIESNNLTPGKVYIIKDFKTIYSSNIKNSQGQYISYGDQVVPSTKYDIAVLAATNNKLFSGVQIISSDPYSIFWNANYDITPEILPDGVVTQGKITYLQDQNLNEASYDFKNVRKQYNEVNYYTFSTIEGLDNSNNCFRNNLTFTTGNIFIGNCSNNQIYGNDNIFLYPTYNCTNNYSNLLFNLDGLDKSFKQVIVYDNKYYLDYLDQDTLTHQFYELSNN